MSWMQRLRETYEGNAHHIGELQDRPPLLPVLHTFQTVHIEVVLDADGEFVRATVVPKDDAGTIIPCTEASLGRSGKRPVSHPLCDALQYVAGDYTKYGGVVTSGYAKDPSKPFLAYCAGLRDWCESPSGHARVEAVYRYVSRRSLIQDLLSEHVLHVGGDQKLLSTWPSRTGRPAIYAMIKDATDAVVRWSVEVRGDPNTRLDRDATVWRSWITYHTGVCTKSRGTTRCGVSGEDETPAVMHPKKILYSSANAKLISSDDKTGYTYRGRFEDAAQACSIGLTVTQKAHNALAWLIGRQAYQRDTQAVVAWAVSGKAIPDPLWDSNALFREATSTGQVSASAELPATGDAGQAFSRRLAKRIGGYQAALGPTEDIVVMGLDSATPGRLAVTFYRELKASEFLDRIERWHGRYAWFQSYPDVSFQGAPSPSDIAAAAFGHGEPGASDELRDIRIDERLSRATVERLLPCIIDGRQLPRDLVATVTRRACRRVGMASSMRQHSGREKKHEWEWEKTLGIACSLFKGFHEERRYDMALETDRRTRDYLYGRLLAIAERLEAQALHLADEDRDTTAARLMQRFSDHPYSTWLNIEKALQPYKSRLQANDRPFLIWITRILDEVHDLFTPTDYTDDRPLSGEYLLAYHCQRRALWERPDDQNRQDPQDDTSDGSATEGDVL